MYKEQNHETFRDHWLDAIWCNTIYAISASNGAVLLSRNLGSPVPTPLGCNANGPNVGINSTPVIDVAAQTLYVVAYTLMSGIPTYQVFALKLNDLTNKLAPITVAASHTLSDGTTYNFNGCRAMCRADEDSLSAQQQSRVCHG